MPTRMLPVLILLIIRAAAAGVPPRLDVIEHRFRNGVTLLMLEHHTAPIVSCSVFYRVGSANEEPGKTGITHLLEHMMFKGTRAIGTKNYASEEPLLQQIEELHEQIEGLEREPARAGPQALPLLREQLADLERTADSLMIKNELWKIYMRRGAEDLNAYTGRDRTQYICSLPANQLELWMWLESDRMVNAVFREFHREKAVVLEERRLSLEDSPAGTFYEQLYATSFIAHPYRWPVIGWKSDLENIRLPMLEAHYRRYYAPNNAVLAIVGDITPEHVIGMAARYFGALPAQFPPPPIVTEEPAQRGRREVRLALEASPRIALAYHRPAVGSDDSAALDVFENILSSGRTSRLYTSLVQRAKVAVSVSVSQSPMKYPSLFVVQCIPRRPHTVDDAATAIRAEIERMAREPANDWEMQKARNQIEADFLRALESTSELSTLVGTFEVIDRWTYLNTYIPRIRAVTPQDVMRVAHAYLKEENCTRVAIP